MFVRGSRSLASMLPSLLSSGVITLVVTAVALHTHGISEKLFCAAWMESWMTAWPIAFPLTYLLRPRSTPKVPHGRRTLAGNGLGTADIAAASARVTRRHGRRVLRGLHPVPALRR